MPTSEDHGRPSTRFVKWLVIGVVTAAVLVFGGIFVYAKVINDAPDKLDTGDLSAALDGGTTPTDVSMSPDLTLPPDSAASTDPSEPATAATVTYDGEWVPTSESQFGYRVKEVLMGVDSPVAGRSNVIDGSLILDGTTATALHVDVEVTRIVSGDPRRDSDFRGRIMEADKYPNASFTLTDPIDFGTIPAPGEQITATATGDLTLHGVTNPVTFDITAEVGGGAADPATGRASGERIGVLGSIPVTFADYGIDNPSTKLVKTEDHGLVEFVIVFRRAT